MRTTIRIDDELYRQVKEKAARTGQTVAAVLEDAVRTGIDPPERRRSSPYVVRSFGPGGPRPGVDLSSNTSVHEAMDDGASLDDLR